MQEAAENTMEMDQLPVGNNRKSIMPAQMTEYIGDITHDNHEPELMCSDFLRLEKRLKDNEIKIAQLIEQNEDLLGQNLMFARELNL